MRRGATALALALLAATPAVTTAATAAPSRVRGWLVTRTGPGGARLAGELVASAAADNAVVMMFALHGRGAARARDPKFATTIALFGVDAWPKAYGQPVTPPACPLVCPVPAGPPTRIQVHANESLLASPVYIAAWDLADATLTIDTPGWRVRPWRPSMRVRTVDESPGSRGVAAAHVSYGTYAGGEIDGGRYGSYVFAALPCKPGDEGYGELSAAGIRPRPVTCDDFGVRAFTNRPVRWRMTGRSQGQAWTPVVFAVVDLPRG